MFVNTNFIGLAAAFATFFGVWLGHVSVRKIERETVNLWKPALIAIALGTGFEIAALLTSSLIFSAIGSILGVTLLWDALELFRQQKRIKRGHAPANPNNPRHAKILAEYRRMPQPLTGLTATRAEVHIRPLNLHR